MAPVAANLECAISAGCYAQDCRHITCHGGSGKGYKRAYGNVPQLLRSGRSLSMVRHQFGTLLGHLSALQKRHQQHRTEVWVAADYPDSKPDASSYLGDLGYHPLEDISSFEKKKNSEHACRRLTDAEIARTLAEVNDNAVIFASLLKDEDHIFGTEVQYVVDKNGDIYFQIDDDSEFLTTLDDSAAPMNVAIGYGSIEDWILEQQEVQEASMPIESEDDISDSDEDEEDVGWSIFTAEGNEFVLDELLEDSSESFGDWSGLETLQSIHPLDFADALASAALADKEVKIEKPSQSLRIVGELHRVVGDEEKYAQLLFEDRFGADEDEKDDNDSDNDKEPTPNDSNDGDNNGQTSNELKESRHSSNELKEGRQSSNGLKEGSTSTSSDAVNNPTSVTLNTTPIMELKFGSSSDSNGIQRSMLWPSDAGIGDSDDDIVMEFKIISPSEGADAETGGEKSDEETDISDSGSSFYKLDIQSIHVISYFKAQSTVDKHEFQAAKPDILARPGPVIVERLNALGKVLEDALKSLCLRQKGLEVEEATLLQIDSFGMDLQVHCGREVQTLRISFSERTMSEEHAEKLLNDLLFPQVPLKGHRKRRSRP